MEMVAVSGVLMYPVVFGGVLIGLAALIGTRYLIRLGRGAEF
jgi:hypothetical protein